MNHDCNPIAEFINVSFAYDGIDVLKDVDLHIHDNEFAWVVGPNGGGKTTLVKLLLGLIHPRAGTIKIFGKSPEKSRSKIGYMPQSINLDSQFPVTVIEVVLMGRIGPGSVFGRHTPEDLSVAHDCLKQVGLENMADRHYSSLSGGQLRRLLIARALACQPGLLVLDEPTANLDPVVQKDFFDLLHQLSDRMAVLMVSHDPAFVSEHVRQVICVKQVVHVHPTEGLSDDILSALYGPGQMRIVQHHVHGKGTHQHD